MKLTPTQHLRLDNAQKAHLARIEAKKTEYEIARRQADDRIASYSHAEDAEIRKAVDAGVPKDRIRTLLQIGHATLNDSLARTAVIDIRPDLEEIAADQRFAWADDEHAAIRVTLAGAEWDEQRVDMGPRIRKNGDESSAEFPVVDGQIIPRSDMYDRTTPNQHDHPVTAWLLYYGGLAQASAWISSQKGAIAA